MLLSTFSDIIGSVTATTDPFSVFLFLHYQASISKRHWVFPLSSQFSCSSRMLVRATSSSFSQYSQHSTLPSSKYLMPNDAGSSLGKKKAVPFPCSVHTSVFLQSLKIQSILLLIFPARTVVH